MDDFSIALKYVFLTGTIQVSSLSPAFTLSLCATNGQRGQSVSVLLVDHFHPFACYFCELQHIEKELGQVRKFRDAHEMSVLVYTHLFWR